MRVPSAVCFECYLYWTWYGLGMSAMVLTGGRHIDLVGNVHMTDSIYDEMGLFNSK